MPDSNASSRMLTLVFTDLADSTALKSQRGDSAADSLVSRHQDHVTRLAAECSGRVIDWAGDGCFLTFEISSAGVIFALRLQQVHTEEPDLPGVRVGIHLGEVTEKPGTGGGPPRVGGLAVDLASRICGLAKPGQVLMSAAVYNSARQRLGVEAFGQPVLWQTHGTYALKGFDEPMDIGEAALQGLAPHEAPTSGDKAKLIRRAKHPALHATPASAAWTRARRFLPPALGAALAITLLGVAYFAGKSKTGGASPTEAPAAYDANAPITSLAVLPLENLSKDPEQEYFADGMTEALTSELSKIKSVRVISRTSVMKYKGTKLQMHEIAAELGVEGLIEGSVQKYGDEVKITAQLIHGPTDTHRWAQSYTNSATNILKLQSEVALAIAEAMKAELTSDEETRIATTRTIDPEAHDAYLLGIHFGDEATGEGLRASIRYFEDATRIDPGFAEAWARLGRSYRYLTSFGFADAGEVYPKARAADMKALELDPHSAMAHSGLGRTLWSYDREWEPAQTQLLRALELDPNYAEGHNGYAYWLLAAGRREEAIVQSQIALDLQPEDAMVVRNAQLTFVYAGQPDRALARLEQVTQDRPDFLQGDVVLLGAYSALGEHEEAIAAAERWVAATNRSAVALSAYAEVLAVSGRLDLARKILEEATSKTGERVAARSSLVYALLGDMDSALKWTEISFDSRDFGVFWYRILPYRNDVVNHPNMIRFRTDPRFREFMDRMKYPPLPPDHPGYAEEQVWLAKKKAAADATAPITKIAVLPFKNISGDPQQEFFVDGMTEALISELAKIKSIKVISRTSAMHFKDSDKKLSDIAAELGVDGVVEGSAMKADNEVRITAQLIRAATDEHLWAESYTEILENVLKVQSKVALKIAGNIQATVTPDEKERMGSANAVKPDAYDRYLEGLYFWGQRTPRSLEQAKRLFTEALELDPGFALAHVALADALLVLTDFEPPARIVELASQAREQVTRALELDPQLGEAYTTLGALREAYDWQWTEAEIAYLKGIELSPGYATAHQWYGEFLINLGRKDEALAEIRKAYELDPFSPVIGITLALYLSAAGLTQHAGEQVEKMLLMHPGNSRVERLATITYCQLDRFQDALRLNDKRDDEFKNDRTLMKAGLLARLSQSGEARELLEKAIQENGDEDSRPTLFAGIYALLDERDKAFEWLDRGVRVRDFGVVSIKSDYGLRSLHGDPRHKALLRRMNFPE